MNFLLRIFCKGQCRPLFYSAFSLLLPAASVVRCGSILQVLDKLGRRLEFIRQSSPGKLILLLVGRGWPATLRKLSESYFFNFPTGRLASFYRTTRKSPQTPFMYASKELDRREKLAINCFRNDAIFCFASQFTCSSNVSQFNRCRVEKSKVKQSIHLNESHFSLS